LLGDSKPNVQNDERPLNPRLAFAASGSKMESREAVRDDFDFFVGPDRRSAADGSLLAITTIFEDASTYAVHHRALNRSGFASTVCSVVTTGMVRRDAAQGYGRRPRRQNSEFVLQTSDVKPAGVQKRRGAHILSMLSSFDLQAPKQDSHRFDRGRSSPR